MSSPPLPDLDALSADGLKRLVVQLLARVAALEEENRRLRGENARLKKLPKRPRVGRGGGNPPPKKAPEAAEAGAGRHGPGGGGAPAAPARPRRRAHAPGHGGA